MLPGHPVPTGPATSQLSAQPARGIRALAFTAVEPESWEDVECPGPPPGKESKEKKMNPDSKLKGMIDLSWGWVMELQDKNQVTAAKVHMAQNIADALTKCLNKSTYS